MEKLQLVISLLGLLGFPTIFAMVLWLVNKIKKDANQIKILMAAQQAQMRSQLLKDYYTYTNRGYVYESELEDWMSQYNAYHSLGANGILDNRKDRLLQLETRAEIVA